MKRSFLAITLAACLLASCSIAAKSALTNAHDRWRLANVGHYRYSLTVACFCAFTQKMPLTIEVRDGQVLSMLYTDGTPVLDADQQTFARYQTIEALFDFTSESLGNADEIHVEYDPTYGFPAKVQIDFRKNAMDDELSLSVSGFERLP
jgi:hypothetical protein